MNAYNWNAEDYQRNSQAQEKWARELIDKLRLNGTEDVLDLGCGDGKVTAEIARLVHNGSIIGVDSSSAMIALASEQYPSSQYPNLSFQVMDARQLAFDGCFDVVFSNAALHWVKDHEPVVRGLFKSLKPGGKILLQMGGKGNARNILYALTEVQSHPEWRQYFDGFEFPYGFLGTDEYEQMLRASGFDISRLELIEKDMVHPGLSGLEGWIRTTWLPYTERVPGGERARFIESISTKYLESVPEDSYGNVHVEMIRLEIEAKKPG